MKEGYQMEREVLKKKKFPHKLDHYLHLVLAKYNGEFVTWEFNSDTGEYFYGHYFDALAKAEVDFDKRYNELAR
jgi:hypothetical protein